MAFTVQILGSSSATPTATRHPSAQVVEAHHKLFLIDCGEGTQMQFRRFRVRYQRIQHIFISHLHGDHYLGLAGLIFTLHLFGRKDPLHVYGNPVLKEIIDLQLKVSDTTLVYPLHFHPLEEGVASVVYEDDHLSVTAFPLLHRVPTHGFAIREKELQRRLQKSAIKDLPITTEGYARLKAGEDIVLDDGRTIRSSEVTLPPRPVKMYAYCSDTGYSDDYLQYIRGADLLYHEATFMQDKVENAREKQHSTTLDAANIALRAGAKKLLVGHYSARYDELQPVIDEVRSLFPESFLAEEGAVFEI